MRPQGNAANVADKPMALTPEQVYKLGAEALGWNNTTTAGKLCLLRRLLSVEWHSFSQTIGAPNVQI